VVRRTAMTGVSAMSRRVTVAAFAALLLAAGCGGGNNHDSNANSPSSQPNSATQPSTSPQPQGSGKFTFSYEDAQSPRAVTGRSQMMDAHMLENVTQNVNDILIAANDVPVTGKHCGEESAYWDGTGIVMCYELVEWEARMFADDGDPDPVTSGVNGNIAAFYHELGHATIALYDLVFTGKEEDVADEASAYILLAPGADGKPDPNGVKVAMAAVRISKLQAAQDDPNNPGYWDTHSTNAQRMYNWACYVYGADPEGNAALVTDGLLPQERADGCQDEFAKMSAAWQQMLGPHMKKPS
jgi:Putative metallopeptidase